MAGTKMYGVVLWSSKDDRKAVIWCEDHGDLAFYNGCHESALDGCVPDVGDLVRFDVFEGRSMRLATAPEVVAEQQYPGLADSLRSSRTQSSPVAVCPAIAGDTTSDLGGNVVRFVPRGSRARMAS